MGAGVFDNPGWYCIHEPSSQHITLNFVWLSIQMLGYNGGID